MKKESSDNQKRMSSYALGEREGMARGYELAVMDITRALDFDPSGRSARDWADRGRRERESDETKGARSPEGEDAASVHRGISIGRSLAIRDVALSMGMSQTDVLNHAERGKYMPGETEFAGAETG